MTIPADIMNDLASRFLVNLPDVEKNDPVRLCFQLELAHWFYLDYYIPDKQRYPGCKECGIREFIRCVIHYFV